MKHYRRAYLPGGVYFFTVVTRERAPWLIEPEAVQRLRGAFRKVMVQKPFTLDAFVLLPNHLHAIWRLPEGDSNFSMRWRLIKHHVSVGRTGTWGWQPRFWEHLLRNDEDWRRHMDYIHYNPVKHGYAESPGEWPYSSFRRAVTCGWYDLKWGESEPSDLPEEVGE